MCLSSKLIGTICILTIVNISKGYIRECRYLQANDTFTYEDLEIPANLTGDYSFLKIVDGSKESVNEHLRACVCKVRPCIRMCCPRKNILANGECNDGLKKEISLTMLNLTMEDIITNDPTIAELRMAPQYNSTKLLVLRDQFQPCDEIFNLKADEYTMLKDGSLLLHSTNEILQNEQYCLYPEVYSDFPKILWIVNRKCIRNLMPATLELTLISLACFILTMAVYLFVEKLRNLLGKCLICCLFGMFMEYFIWTLDQFNLLYGICTPAGYSKYYFSMASYLWFSVISYHLKKLFTSLNRYEARYLFLKYSAFVWGTAAIPTGVIYLMNEIWGEDPEKRNWMPLVGFIGCSVQDWGWSSWIYFHGPILILTTFNATMFVLTAVYIWKVKREVNRFSQQTLISFSCFSYLQFLRLFVIMGVSWILDRISRLAEDFHFFLGTIFLNITIYLNATFGIIIFGLLILKGSTIKLLMDR
ncbi:probable G-protein coupled receptor Mth-like 12 [Drosophila takahashii]|uniref:probable G-protein coupled receptor Mth-like 12 n=1 Tax=Drosophila takahashii TaxID=29030 RepID=UPI001CF84157|nr:probable G-protein coupled receptor Mth-like 12 [Drosophila takahashii]